MAQYEHLPIYKQTYDILLRTMKWSRLVEQVGSVVKVYRGSFMLPVS